MVMLARRRRVSGGQHLDVMVPCSVTVSEIESYLAVMRLINVALTMLTEWAQGTGVAPRPVLDHQ